MRTKLKLLLVLASLGVLAALATSSTASAAAARRLLRRSADHERSVRGLGRREGAARQVRSDGRGERASARRNRRLGLLSTGRECWGSSRATSRSRAVPRASLAPANRQAATCYDMIVTSEKPGLAKIKLETASANSFDFLVIWMTMNKPNLDELASGEIPGLVVGDPLGDGIFAPVDIDPVTPGWQGDPRRLLPGGRHRQLPAREQLRRRHRG